MVQFCYLRLYFGTNNVSRHLLQWIATINPRTYKQIHTPTVVQRGGQGGWMESLPGVFDMLQYFETILPLAESL